MNSRPYSAPRLAAYEKLQVRAVYRGRRKFENLILYHCAALSDCMRQTNETVNLNSQIG